MPSQLSGGQQQRIALARTIIVEPEVLLLDEPLSDLDVGLRVQMRSELLRLQRQLGLTTIFVTHDHEEANMTSDRMAVLNGGGVQRRNDAASRADYVCPCGAAHEEHAALHEELERVGGIDLARTAKDVVEGHVCGHSNGSAPRSAVSSS